MHNINVRVPSKEFADALIAFIRDRFPTYIEERTLLPFPSVESEGNFVDVMLEREDNDAQPYSST